MTALAFSSFWRFAMVSSSFSLLNSCRYSSSPSLSSSPPPVVMGLVSKLRRLLPVLAAGAAVSRDPLPALLRCCHLDLLAVVVPAVAPPLMLAGDVLTTRPYNSEGQSVRCVLCICFVAKGKRERKETSQRRNTRQHTQEANPTLGRNGTVGHLRHVSRQGRTTEQQ